MAASGGGRPCLTRLIQGDGIRWYVVCIPAETKHVEDVLGRKIGELIWPEWCKPGHFAPFRRSPRTRAALYEQRRRRRRANYGCRRLLVAVHLRELEERRTAILNSVRGQGKLDAALEAEILTADSKGRLEDIYLPFKPKRRT